jgi:hypothetical protein
MNLTKEDANRILYWFQAADHESLTTPSDAEILKQAEESFPGILKEHFIDLNSFAQQFKE